MKSIIKQVIEEAKGLCYQDTKMALECICETLFYQHGIDAKHCGRSIYVGKERVASIRTCIEPCEDCKCIGIYDYKVIGG